MAKPRKKRIKQIPKQIYLRGRASQRREDHSELKSLTVHWTRRQEIGAEESLGMYL